MNIKAIKSYDSICNYYFSISSKIQVNFICSIESVNVILKTFEFYVRQPMGTLRA